MARQPDPAKADAMTERKREYLAERGFRVCGYVMVNPETGDKATIDHSHVTWAKDNAFDEAWREGGDDGPTT